MNTETKLSVIIPTYKRPKSLSRCLAAVMRAAEALDPGFVEVIVSDDDPSGDARQVVSRSAQFVIWNQGPGRGPAANRNSGARQSTGELLIFLDDDCIPDQELLFAYAEAAADNPRIDLFEGKIVADRQIRYAHEFCPVNIKGGCLWSANIAVRRGCFEALCGFDEDFPFAGMEDIDFHCRCKKASKQILFCPRASVIHPVDKRTGAERLRRGRYVVLLFAEKHPDQVDRLLAGYNLRGLLRRAKQGILQCSLVQPLDAYCALAAELYSNFQLFRILRDPGSISQMRKELGREVLDVGDPRREASLGDWDFIRHCEPVPPQRRSPDAIKPFVQSADQRGAGDTQ